MSWDVELYFCVPLCGKIWEALALRFRPLWQRFELSQGEIPHACRRCDIYFTTLMIGKSRRHQSVENTGSVAGSWPVTRNPKENPILQLVSWANSGIKGGDGWGGGVRYNKLLAEFKGELYSRIAAVSATDRFAEKLNKNLMVLWENPTTSTFFQMLQYIWRGWKEQQNY